MTEATAPDHLRVLVSGAAAGIGLACAAAFAERGAELILCDQDGTGLTRASDDLSAFSRFCDVLSESSVAIFAAEIEQKFGSIDVLINAAGRRYVRSLGIMRLSRAMLPLLRKAAGQRLLVNVRPAGGFVPADGIFPNGGSHESFDRMSGALADQTRGASIKVVTVTPRAAANIAFDTVGPDGRAYRLERIDDWRTAEEVVSLVAAERPEWRLRPSRRNRCA